MAIERAYTAGPMTGLPMYNWGMFAFAADFLRGEGWDIVTPIEIDEDMGVVAITRDQFGAYESVTTTDLFDYDLVLSRDLAAIDTCTAIVLLPDWHKSKGAKIELARALSLNLNVYTWEELYV